MRRQCSCTQLYSALVHDTGIKYHKPVLSFIEDIVARKTSLLAVNSSIYIFIALFFKEETLDREKVEPFIKLVRPLILNIEDVFLNWEQSLSNVGQSFRFQMDDVFLNWVQILSDIGQISQFEIDEVFYRLTDKSYIGAPPKLFKAALYATRGRKEHKKVLGYLESAINQSIGNRRENLIWVRMMDYSAKGANNLDLNSTSESSSPEASTKEGNLIQFPGPSACSLEFMAK